MGAAMSVSKTLFHCLLYLQMMGYILSNLMDILEGGGGEHIYN